MKAIITKYALTSGPFLLEGRIVAGGDFQAVDIGRDTHYKDADFHTERMLALDRVANMAARKRKSLEKQLRDLEGKVEKAIKKINEMEL